MGENSMSIISAGNEADWWQYTGINPNWYTTTAQLDIGFSHGYLGIDKGDYISKYFEPTTDIWFHATVYTDSEDSTNFWLLYSGTIAVFRLFITGSSPYQMQYYDLDTTSWVVIADVGDTLHSLIDRKVVQLDFEVKVHATEGRFALYVNGELASEYTGDTTVAGITDVNWFRCGGSNDSPSETAWTEMIISSTSTLEYRSKLLRLTADGAEDEWTGDFSHLTETEEALMNAEVMQSDTADQVQTLEVEDYIVPVGYEIAAVTVNVAFSMGTTGPQNLELGVQSGASTSSDTITGLPLGQQNLSYVAEVDPATGLPWTSAALNALKISLVSRT